MTTRGFETLSAKARTLKGRRKPTDIFVTADIFLQILKESEDGVTRGEKGEFSLTFATENSDTLDFTLESTDEGIMVAVSKFSDEYIRMTGVPSDYRDSIVIDSLLTKNSARAKTMQTAEKSIATKPAVEEKKQTSNVYDVVNGMSDEELEAILAARRGNTQDKPEEDNATHGDEPDSDSGGEAEKQSSLRGSETDSDNELETQYDDQDQDNEDDDGGYDDDEEDSKYANVPNLRGLASEGK